MLRETLKRLLRRQQASPLSFAQSVTLRDLTAVHKRETRSKVRNGEDLMDLTGLSFWQGYEEDGQSKSTRKYRDETNNKKRRVRALLDPPT
mmetsp:Transcript_11421/g.21997  ORF Transcript_11421/g.21997 Transcript_11421/m.21997 type:complete len:91 (-) Transcript_11421:66-338(-)